MSKDFYSILEIDKGSTQDDIKKAYRKMSKKYHPDVNKESNASDKFKEISEAYDVLSNPEKRSNYDNFGTTDGQGSFGGFDINDIFGSFFGGGKKKAKKGQDLRVKVSLSIIEIIDGVKKKIKYNRQVSCQPCNGEGGTNVSKCNSCNGSGERMVIQNSMFGQVRTTTQCSDCQGSGNTIGNKCNVCNGRGTSLKEELLDIDIPAGVGNGMQLTMQGYGNDIKNGVSGDLNIIVDEIREYYFKREGGNLIIEKDISIIDAIVGASILVKTPKGEMSINVEPGSEHGKLIRVRGAGIPDLNYGLGDLIIVLKIKVPNSISESEKEILNSLRASENFKV